MGAADIDTYVTERLKTPEGKWIHRASCIPGISDVMFCLSYCMENFIPYPKSSDYNNRVEEYERLVEQALAYLSAHPSLEESFDLLMVVTQDLSDSKQNERVRTCLQKTVENLYSYYFFERKSS